MNTEPQTSIEEAREELRDAVEEVIEGADNLAIAQVHAETQLAQTVAATAVVEAQLETAVTKTELEEAREQLLWETNRRVELEAEASRQSQSLEIMTARVAELTEQVTLLTSQTQAALSEATETPPEPTPEIQPVETDPTLPPHTDTPPTDAPPKSEEESQVPEVVEQVQEILSVPVIRFL